MKVVRHRTARELLTAAAGFFEATEERNHLILAVAESVTRRGGDESAFFATVEDGGVVAVALQTPPWPLQVTTLSRVDELCDALPWRPTAVTSDPETARAIAERLGGGTVRKHLRSHVLTRVTAGARTGGTLRLASERDLPMLVEWFRDYFVDIDSPQRDLFESAARRGVAEQITRVWETDRPVAMATLSGRTPRGRRVGDVFTPLALRGRGYAEALTAALSQRVLDEGATWCFLFTDVENPTSNAIYRRVGYTPNGDVHEVEIALTPRAPPASA